MKTQRSILLAFLLNLLFSLFEFAGGILTGSVAILSDALHDIADAATIGISYFLEKKSTKQPDEVYTYGYARFSVLGGAITALILLVGSGIVIYHALVRMVSPSPIHYDGMILFAVIGVCVNLCAAWITGKGESLNQKTVNLHMLEDVLGWAVVLVGAVVMRFTDIAILDPILSIGVALFIIVHAVRHLKEALCLFLEKAPSGIKVKEVKDHLCQIPGISDVHHIHLWSMDEHSNYATMHIVTNADPVPTKEAVRKALHELGIGHVTLELEAENEHCHEKHCHFEHHHDCGHHHHH